MQTRPSFTPLLSAYRDFGWENSVNVSLWESVLSSSISLTTSWPSSLCTGHGTTLIQTFTIDTTGSHGLLTTSTQHSRPRSHLPSTFGDAASVTTTPRINGSRISAGAGNYFAQFSLHFLECLVACYNFYLCTTHCTMYWEFIRKTALLHLF